MSAALPERPSLDWLKKTAKQQLRTLRARKPDAKLAEAQLALAREYGFRSWRALRAHVGRLRDSPLADAVALNDHDVAAFLRHVGAGRIERVRELLATTPHLINAIGPHPYWGGRPQALHVSIDTRRRDLFDLLLAAGADIDGSNEHYDHWSPLMLTVERGQPDMRRALLERGAKVGLFEALLFGDDAAVRALLSRGRASVPKADPNGGSILALARTPFAIDRLLELGAPREVRDRWGATPVETMSRLGPSGQPLVRHMLARGIEAQPQEFARLGDQTTLAALIAKQPAIARADAVMMAAVDFGHHDLVRWLLAQGASVNARAPAHSGQSALHSAAWNGDLAMAKLLVGAGADVRALDAEHRNTAAGWARVSIEISNNPKCREVSEFLEGLGGAAKPGETPNGGT